MQVKWICLWAFDGVLWEHVFWPVDVLAEFKVVDLFHVAAVAVFANHQVKDLFGGRHEGKILKHAEELRLRDVLASTPVKVLEAWLEENAAGNYLRFKLLHGLRHFRSFFL